MKKIYLDFNKEKYLWDVKVVRDFIIFEYIIEEYEFSKIQAALKKLKQLEVKYN